MNLSFGLSPSYMTALTNASCWDEENASKFFTSTILVLENIGTLDMAMSTSSMAQSLASSWFRSAALSSAHTSEHIFLTASSIPYPSSPNSTFKENLARLLAATKINSPHNVLDILISPYFC